MTLLQNRVAYFFVTLFTLLDLAAVSLLKAAPGDLYESDSNSGSIIKFTPTGTQSCFACNSPSSGFTTYGLALDSSATVFVALTVPSGGSNIDYITQGGTQGIFWAQGPAIFGGLAFDSLGNLFVAEHSNGLIAEFTAPPPGCPNCTFRSIFASGLIAPYGLAFDQAGNLFVADGDSILMFTPLGVRSTFASGLNVPIGLAFDSSGNLFVADFGSNAIFEFTPSGVQSTFAAGLNGPFGLAIDAQNNVFESDYNSNAIFQFSPAGAQTLFASALNGPTYLAFEQGAAPTPTPTPAMCQTGQVVVNNTTCSQFSSGTATLLPQVTYTVNSSGLINGADPGKFMYWVKVNAVAGTNTFVINQSITTGNFNTQFMLDTSFDHVFTANCGSLSGASFTQNTTTGPSSTVTVTFNAPSAGTYFIELRFNTTNIKAYAAPMPATVHYSFSTAGVPGSTCGVDLVKK